MAEDRNSKFWDTYIDNWNASGKEGIPGSEWGSKDEFVNLLDTYIGYLKSDGKEIDAVEIGCGAGRVTLDFVGKFKSLIITDVSEAMLSECIGRIIGKGDYTAIQLCDDVVNLPIADNFVNLVFSHDVFVHFGYYEMMEYFKEISRILKPDGFFIASFYEMTIDNISNYDNVSKGYNEAKYMFQYRPHNISFVTREMIEFFSYNAGLIPSHYKTGNFLSIVLKKGV